MDRWQQFFSELRRRRVFRALVGWGILSFAVLQVIEPIMHALGLGEWTLKVVVGLLALGFPVSAALSWVYDLRRTGIERTPAAPEGPGTPASPRTGRIRLALLLLGLGAAAASPGLVYFFVWPGAARRPAEKVEAGPAVRAAPSIAVLAFADMSPGKDQEYFADGLSEELLNLLAKVPGLRVAARTSSFAFKGKNEDVAQIGQKLHVAHILEGSVRKAGDQIRITTQLINVSDGFHLWSETYDRRITDVFAVQDEIAKAVVGALKLQLLAAPGSKERRTTSAEAHDLYLKGLYLWNQRSPDALLRAADFFREAIRADPGYALAYVGLADAIQVRTGYAWIRSSELGAQAKAAALHALELEPDLGEAHASLGIMLANDFDWPAALDHYRKAIALRPNYATAHQWYAGALSALGRAAEARQEIELALRLDPTSRVIHLNAGQFAMEARDYPRAERHYRAALDLAPDFQSARSELAMVYARDGKRAEALAELQKVSPLSEDRHTYPIVHALTGQRPEAEREARELEAFATKHYVPATILASVWAALGDKDRTFAALRRVCQERDGAWGASVKVDPLYDGLRSDPRYGEILDCLNLR